MMKFLILYIFCCFQFFLIGQEKIPNNFGYPLEGNKTFTGNYGEIRPNHFHAGLDFTTDPVKNLPIHSIGDGYVSRIKIGSGGYGKVLYVTHPNGYVSVYAHEHHFAKKIHDFAFAEQKRLESFEVEIFPKPEDLPVKKGEVIGYTGNTGNTTGPHLHFEIREEKTEIPLNPQLFLEHDDTEAPVCYKMAVYKIKQNYEPELFKSYDLKSQNKKTDFQLKEIISLPNNAGLAFSCFDREHKGGSNNQVYSLAIYIDDSLFYLHKMNGISFDQARYVNCYTDLDPKVKNEKLQKCFRVGNNELPIFVKINNDGKIHSMPAGNHKAKVVMTDVKGNKSSFSFDFVQDTKVKMDYLKAKIKCKEKNEIHEDGMDVLFPENCFFYDLPILPPEIPKASSAYVVRSQFKIGSSQLQIFKSFELSILIRNLMSTHDKQDKLCLIHLDDDKKNRSYAGGEFKDGKVSGTVKNLGWYEIGIDDVAPSITRLYVSKKSPTNLSKAKGIFFKVGDNLSGIGTFRMEINGKWVLAEYEHKTNTIFYLFNDETPKGEIVVELKVWDKKKNVGVFKKSYQR